MKRLLVGGDWRATARRLAKILLAMAGMLVLLYFWQPYRIDWFAKTPPRQPPVGESALRIFRPGARALLVMAHPDDDAYFLGGTLIKLRDAGATIAVVEVTSGDKSYYPFHDFKREVAMREAEAKVATQVYCPLQPIFLRQRDGRLELSERLVARIAQLVAVFNPDAIFFFDPDYPPHRYHRDHLTSGQLAVAATRMAGFHGWLAMFATSAPNCWIDVTDQWPREEKFIAGYASQWRGDRLTESRSRSLRQPSRTRMRARELTRTPFGSSRCSADNAKRARVTHSVAQGGV